MAGTTANGIPYPTGSDRVMDGDNAMQAMAEKIDPSVASKEVGASMTPGVGGWCSVLRRGRTVHCHFDITAGAGGVGVGAVLCVIPAGYRPQVQTFFTAMQASAPIGIFSVEINQTNGNFLPNITGLAANARIIGSWSWALPQAQA